MEKISSERFFNVSERISTLKQIKSMYFKNQLNNEENILWRCLEKVIYPYPNNVTPPDLSEEVKHIDIIFEMGDEISIEEYGITPQNLHFVVHREILYGDAVELDIQSDIDFEEFLQDNHNYDYLEKHEFIIIGCREGTLN